MGYICGCYNCKDKSLAKDKVCEDLCKAALGKKFDNIFSYGKVCIASFNAQLHTVNFAGREYAICFNGKLFNTKFLIKELTSRGARLKTQSHGELALYAYIIWREDFVNYLDGHFALCIYDLNSAKFLLVRDRFGVKPLFYCEKNGVMYFSSRLSPLLECAVSDCKINKSGLYELFTMSPSRADNVTLFSDIHILEGGSILKYDMYGTKTWRYYTLKCTPVADSISEASTHIRYLTENSIRRIFDNNKHCTVMLSGGVDSSVIAGVGSVILRQQDMTVKTCSLEHEDSSRYFTPCAYVPSLDDEFSAYMAKWLGCEHKVYTCKKEDIIENLFNAVDAVGLPARADIDSSLLYFLKEIGKSTSDVASGMCADVVFGGHPWLYNSDIPQCTEFAWIYSPMHRIKLVKDGAADTKSAFEYYKSKYNALAKQSDEFNGDNMRFNTYMTYKCYTQPMLEYTDALCEHSCVEMELPYADVKLLEYALNLPYEIKCQNNLEKSLLRNSMCNYLPERVMYRKKSPFQKSFNADVQKLLCDTLAQRFEHAGILKELFDKSAVTDYINSPENIMWFGQNLSKYQLVAWLIQLDYWCEKFNVNFEI